MAGANHGDLEARLQHLRQDLHNGNDLELDDGEESPGHDLAVQV